jgi:hypothetical protein
MKKFALIIVLLIISITAFSQTTISRRQIRDDAIDSTKLANEAVTQYKLAPGVGRPVISGVLPSPTLTFGPELWKEYTVTVDSDFELALAGSGNVAYSKITIRATGDGAHELGFPSNWIPVDSAQYDPNSIQRIDLEYDGTDVFYEIQVTNRPIIVPTLLLAVMDEGTDDLTLTFSSPVTITTAGWSVTASGGAATVSSVVSGSGFAVVVFDLSRNITSGEDMTISYNPSTGNTVSSTNNELLIITSFFVDTGDEELPENVITVGPSGQDYTTIQAGSDAATNGQIVQIKGGTYRETVTGKTGVTYQPFPGETVIISGLNTVGTSWSVHSGSIYKTTIALPITGFNQSAYNNTPYANQIFDDGEMQIQAGWPNRANKEELFDMYKFRHQSSGTNLVTGSQGTGFQPSTVTDAGAAVGTLGNLTGGTIFITGWYQSATRTISNHSGNTITFPAYSNNTAINVNFRKWFHVTNKLSLLDIAREWHYEAGILYHFAQGGGSPTNIEYKARNWGFDLRNRQDITIKGITFYGCEVAGDGNTSGVILDNIRGYYTNHVVMVESNWERHNMEKTGFRLIGANNVIKDSEFDFGASQCLWLGDNGQATNNQITNYGYEGNYGAAVSLWGNTSNHLITRNTMTGMGRSCVDFSMGVPVTGAWAGSNLNTTISYNDMSDYCKINNDGGAIYTARMTNTTGLVVNHNWIHNSGAKPDPQGIRVEGILAAIYMDQGTGPGTFHHNVLYDNWENMPAVQDRTDAYILSRYSTRTNTPGSYWYNNNFESDITGSAWSYITYLVDPGDLLINCIFDGTIVRNWGGNTLTGAPPGGGPTLVTNSILSNVDPVYLGTGTGGLIYRLDTGSPARNAGVHIPGITDNDPTSPDAGAYAFADNADQWAPGYNAVTLDDDVFIQDNSPFTLYSVSKTIINNSVYSGSTASFHNTDEATITVTLPLGSTGFEWHAEKFNSHGIVEVKVDGTREDCDTGTGGTQDCDCYQNTSTPNTQLIFSKTGLSAGSSHTVLLTLKDKNVAVTGTPYVVHDAIKAIIP